MNTKRSLHLHPELYVYRLGRWIDYVGLLIYNSHAPTNWVDYNIPQIALDMIEWMCLASRRCSNCNGRDAIAEVASCDRKSTKARVTQGPVSNIFAPALEMIVLFLVPVPSLNICTFPDFEERVSTTTLPRPSPGSLQVNHAQTILLNVAASTRATFCSCNWRQERYHDYRGPRTNVDAQIYRILGWNGYQGYYWWGKKRHDRDVWAW